MRSTHPDQVRIPAECVPIQPREVIGFRVQQPALRSGICDFHSKSPPKRFYTAHESRKRAEQGFARPYGKAYGLFVDLVEYRTVRHGRSKSGGVLGVAEPQGGRHRRPTIEALCPYGGFS